MRIIAGELSSCSASVSHPPILSFSCWYTVRHCRVAASNYQGLAPRYPQLKPASMRATTISSSFISSSTFSVFQFSLGPTLFLFLRYHHTIYSLPDHISPSLLIITTDETSTRTWVSQRPNIHLHASFAERSPISHIPSTTCALSMQMIYLSSSRRFFVLYPTILSQRSSSLYHNLLSYMQQANETFPILCGKTKSKRLPQLSITLMQSSCVPV